MGWRLGHVGVRNFSAGKTIVSASLTIAKLSGARELYSESQRLSKET